MSSSFAVTVQPDSSSEGDLPVTPTTPTIEDSLVAHSTERDLPIATTSVTSKSPRKKLEYFDGVRGIMAWVVLNSHFISGPLSYRDYISTLPHPIHVAADLLIAGPLGVSLFFVLSGRVLALGFLAKPETTRLASAFVRRPFRMMIPVFGSLLIHYVVAQLNGYSYSEAAADARPSWRRAAKQVAHSREETSLAKVFINTLTLFVGGPLPPYPDLPQWTINAELAGSFFVYTVALIACAFSRHRWAVHAALTFYYVWTGGWTANFLAGLWIADLSHTGALHRLQRNRYINLIRGALLIFAIYALTKPQIIYDIYNTICFDAGKGVIGRDEMFPFWAWNVPYFFASVAIILLLDITPLFQRAFETRLMRFLGRISFGLYLLHPVVYNSFGAVLVYAVFTGLPDSDFALQFFLVYIPTLFVIILASLLFTMTFDRWSISFGRKLEELLRSEWSRDAQMSWLKRLKQRNYAWRRRIARKCSWKRGGARSRP